MHASIYTNSTSLAVCILIISSLPLNWTQANEATFVDREPHSSSNNERAVLTKYYTENNEQILIKNNKAVKPENIIVEVIITGGTTLLHHIETIFNHCLNRGITSEA